MPSEKSQSAAKIEPGQQADRDKSDSWPAGTVPEDRRCWRCGGATTYRHCKIICQRCGFMRDCSDP